MQAYADRLSSYYAIRARQAVLVGAEVQEWAAFDEYSLAQLQADALRMARTARNASLKQERQRAHQWEGYFRTGNYSLFKRSYTYYTYCTYCTYCTYYAYYAGCIYYTYYTYLWHSILRCVRLHGEVA